MKKVDLSCILSVGALAAIFLLVCNASAQINGASEFSGRATGIKSVITVGTNTPTTTAAGDTCPLPPRGGTSVVTSSGPLVMGVVGSGAITSSTSGIGLTSQSSSSVTDFIFVGGGWDIRARNISSNTQCNCCDIAMPQCSGETTITGLTVTAPGGTVVPVTVSGQPNQVVTLPNGAGTLTINERPTSTTSGTITIVGLHLNIAAGGTNYNIEVARAHSDIVCAQAVITPAEVNVSGRAVLASGQGVAGATVTLTDPQGNVLSAVSNTNGSYTITNVTVGRTYILTARARGVTFGTRAVSVLDEITDLDIVGQK